ncbi:MAG: maleylacetoacetate isomerase [Hyphomicrobiaceae bacterium]
MMITGKKQSEAGMILYGYWRSAATFRVRIALALKGLAAELRPVDLSRNEQHSPAYRAVNPQGIVPTLVDGAATICQSLAIIEYLEEVYPDPALLPEDAAARARSRAVAVAVAAELQGRTGTSIRDHLLERFGADVMTEWYRHWALVGCAGLEGLLSREPLAGRFCFGDRPGLADCFLYPQYRVFERRGVDLGGFPTLRRIADACRSEPAFIHAAPENQPDRVVDPRF